MAVSGYLLIECKGADTRSVVGKIKGMPGVKACHTVTGPYDIIAFCEASDLQAWGAMVLDKVRTFPGVEKTITCVAVE